MYRVLSSFVVLTSLLSQALSTPFSLDGENIKQRAADVQPLAHLHVVKTTVTDTQTIDWVTIESQGDIASPPPPLEPFTPDPSRKAYAPAPQTALMTNSELGPEGTVPIPRVSAEYLAAVKSFKKSLPPANGSNGSDSNPREKRQYSGQHWYATSNQDVANLGGTAVFSAYSAFVDTNDFSLLQTAVTKINPAQTIEAGWINYPNQVTLPHLFTFFTTNGYSQEGDNLGGWNTDQQGWIQVDTTIFPGTVLSPHSLIGGDQYEIAISYQLYEGNWWLNVLGTWIGYYPASLFSAGQSGETLATGSDRIFYYGEIYQTENAETTTDMGSGEFADTGFGMAAYIHNMVYEDTNGLDQTYTAGFGVSDSSRYSAAPTVGDDQWGSYVYLGGPGAGGVVGS